MFVKAFNNRNSCTISWQLQEQELVSQKDDLGPEAVSSPALIGVVQSSLARKSH